MTPKTTDILRKTAATLAQSIDDVFSSLDELKQAALPLLDAPNVKHESLSALEPAVRKIIERHVGLVTGAGVAVSVGALADASAWMQSWHSIGAEVAFTRHSLNPASMNYYDYTDMIWFQRPRLTGLPSITGPYMDFGGTDTRIITAALPVESWNDTVSVLVADISLSHLERLLLMSLAALNPEVALVTDTGKVVATNSARLAVSGKPSKPLKLAVPLPTANVSTGWELQATV